MEKESKIWESLVAVLVIALGVVAWVMSASFPTGDNAVYGPALFPRVLATILFASSAVVLWGSWFGPNNTNPTSEAFDWSQLVRVAGLLVALAFAPFLLANLGMLATTVILTGGVCLLLGAKWYEALGACVFMYSFVFLVFVLLLKVNA